VLRNSTRIMHRRAFTLLVVIYRLRDLTVVRLAVAILDL
jgi:hypothetical protein